MTHILGALGLYEPWSKLLSLLANAQELEEIFFSEIVRLYRKIIGSVSWTKAHSLSSGLLALEVWQFGLELRGCGLSTWRQSRLSACLMMALKTTSPVMVLRSIVV